MAISIPIISEFVDTGVKKAVKEFKQLETTGAKAQFALKKAAIPAAAAMGALTVAMGDAVKAAMEDEKAQQLLARQLKASTGATDNQIKSVEKYITVQGRNLGITDDQLRPALAGLVRVTKDVDEAQKATNLAMDIAAAKGTSLETVTKAMEKAYGGNLNALAKLDPSVRQMIKDGASLEEVFATLQGTFSGAAKEASNTAAGGFAKMKLALDETKESIGAALLPAIQKVLPYLQRAAEWAQDNPKAFTIIAGTIAGVATAILAVNAAMALNPFGLIAVGIAALVTGITIAYTRFETFRNIVRAVINGVASYIEFMANAWVKATNTIIRGLNLINPFKDIPYLGDVKLGRIGGDGGGSRSTVAAISAGDMPGAGGGAGGGSGAIPGLGAGVAQSAASRATSAARSAVVVPKGPDGYVGPMGLPEISLGGLRLDQIDPSIGGTAGMAAAPDVTINVNGGDPNAVVDALREYMRQNGSIPITVSPF
jgi:hypothetical protein